MSLCEYMVPGPIFFMCRLPLVAPCERSRILESWSRFCNGTPPQEHSLDFAHVRNMSPQDFVTLLADQLKVKGVVAGGNYKFGYKAAGDAQELQRLCERSHLAVQIVEPVLDATRGEETEAESEDSGYISGGSDVRQVSSTRVRKALKAGDMERAAFLLGRRHRVVVPLIHVRFERCEDLEVDTDKEGCEGSEEFRECGAEMVDLCESEGGSGLEQTAVFSRKALLNEAPGDGEYVCQLYLHRDGTQRNEGTRWDEIFVGEGVLTLTSDEGVVLMFESLLDECVSNWTFLGIEC